MRDAATSLHTRSLAAFGLLLLVAVETPGATASGRTPAAPRRKATASRSKSPTRKQKLDLYFNRGLELYREQDYAGALEQWSLLLLRDPDNRRVAEYIDRAYTSYNRAHDFYLEAYRAEQRRDFDLCTDLLQKSLRVSLLLSFPVFDDYGQRKFETAQDMLRRVSRDYEKAKERGEARIERGKEAMEEGDYQEARAEFETALALAGEKRTRARVQRLIEDVERKSRERKEEEEARTHLRKGEKLFRAKKYADAEREFETVLSIDGDNEQAQEYINRIGDARKRKGRAQKTKAVRENLARVYKYMHVARDYHDDRDLLTEERKGDLDRYWKLLRVSERLLQDTLAIDPESVDARSYGAALVRMREEMTRRVELDEEVLRLLDEASALGKAGRYEDASLRLRTVLLLLDRERKSHHYRVAREVLREYRKRIAAAESRKEERNRERARKRLAQARRLYEEGKLKSALAKVSETLRLDPDNGDASQLRYDIGFAMSERGEEDVDSPLRRLAVMLEIQGDTAREQRKYALAADLYGSAIDWKRDAELRRKYNAANRRRKGGTQTAATYVRLARTRLGQGRLADARRQLDRARALSPNSASVRKLADDLERARVRKRDASRADVQKLLADAESAYRDGSYSKTLELCRPILEADASQVQARILENKARMKLAAARGGGTGGASADLTPEQQAEVNRRFYQGTRYYIAGKLEKAMQEWEKVLDLDPEHLKAQHNLEKCRSKLALARATE